MKRPATKLASNVDLSSMKSDKSSATLGNKVESQLRRLSKGILIFTGDIFRSKGFSTGLLGNT